MTLHIATAQARFALLVSDREVSQANAHQVKSYDSHANKSLLCLAPGGIMAIGYTGLAYVGRIPTDQWIAEVLAKAPAGSLSEIEGWRPAFSTRRGFAWPNVGAGLCAVRDSLAALAKESKLTNLIEIIAVGF